MPENVPENTDTLLYKHVPDLLHERVARHWQNWSESCALAGLKPEAENSLPVLGKAWACSEFVAHVMIRNPQLYFELIQSDAFNQSFSFEHYCFLLNQRLEKTQQSDPGLSDDRPVMQPLRFFRQQQMLRIAWRDLAGLADTTETLRNLSELAECCIDITLERLFQAQCKQLGTPLKSDGTVQRLVVLGMGKLGGYELNFSSDIDLIFAYAEEGEVEGSRALANSQFFIRLGQRFIKVLNDVTADGFVFRVDMRLRPYGDSGPLVMSHDAMEQYYQAQGRNWERYAMIKARVVGGDREQGQAIMAMLKPFVYRRYLDFGAFESIREMKRLIDTEIRRKGNFKNIKLGLGGIREIEFIGQTFQLIRGGSDTALQIRGIVDVLKLLAEKNYLAPEESRSLLSSYDFLRRLENRLQMYADAQTHLLPENEEQQLSMALAMGYTDWDGLFNDCEKHRQAVHHSFVLLLHNEDDDPLSDEKGGDSLDMLWLSEMDEAEAVRLLESEGMAEAGAVYLQLKQFAGSSQLKSASVTGRQRLDTLMPGLLKVLIEQPNTSEVLKRLISLLHSILRRSVYLSLLNEYPAALQQLVKLCAASPWIAHLLKRYPVLLDELLDPRNLYQIQTPEKLKDELDALLQQTDSDEEQQMERLRMFKQAQVLKIAAMDMAGAIDVFEVSEQLSNVAQTLLNKVMLLAWHWMVAKHGRPMCVIEGKKRPATLGIVAYGKMGGRELGYGSDLDLVFLHDSAGSEQQTEGERSLDNGRFFARLAQRIIHILGSQTANGRLYEIDMRLRPDGNAGMLVSSLQAYDIYQHEKAWTWEHQALIRARMVCFSPHSGPHLKTEFDRIRHSILIRQRDRQALIADIAEMRTKMRAAKDTRADSAKFHLKQGAGGLVDIEFIVQYGVLLCAAENESLTQSTASRKLLSQLAACNVLTEVQADALYKAYHEYRGLSHRCALQELASVIDDPAENSPVGALRLKVKEIWLNVIEKHVSE